MKEYTSTKEIVNIVKEVLEADDFRYFLNEEALAEIGEYIEEEMKARSE